MRTLWSVFSFLAVVHLLGLLLFLAWLWQSQRLTADRMEQVRATFALTVPQAQAAAAKAAEDTQAEQARQVQIGRQENPPSDSASQAEYIALIKQQEAQARRRLEAEKNALQQQLLLATVRIHQQQKELDQRSLALNKAVEDDRERKNDEQFMQIVRQYEQVPPKQGKRMIMELVQQHQTEQACAYLAAMNSRAFGKILKEFKTDQEIALATELLERLRTSGQDKSPTAGGAMPMQSSAPSMPAQESHLADGSSASGP